VLTNSDENDVTGNNNNLSDGSNGNSVAGDTNILVDAEDW